MIPWRFCWNNIRLQPTRTLLTILSVAGGVAAVVAVLQSTAATRSELATLHQTLASRVAMEIVADDTTAFSPESLSFIGEQPGVHAAVPIARVFAKIVAGHEEVRGLVLGVDLERYREIRDFEITSGRMCRDPGEACLEATVAERLGVSTGSEVKMGARGLPWLLKKKVVGILKPLGISAVEESASAFVPLADGARLGKAPKKITGLQIVLRPEADAESVASGIRSQLPGHLLLVKAASAGEMSRPTENIINTGLTVAATLSVVAAIFIVLNTFQISIAERRRQLALIRIVGATPDQIRKSMYREALLFAMAGTTLGIVLGIAVSRFMAQGMQDIFGFTSVEQIAIQPRAILAGLTFGPLITLLSVWHPARTACDAPPLGVLKSATAPHRNFPIRGAAQLGFVVLAMAAMLLSCACFEILSAWTSVAGIAMVQLASLLFLPSLIGPGTSLIYGMLRPLVGIEAQLGHQQLLNNFGRTALTAAVLFVVSAISISIGNTVLILSQDVQSWLDRTLTADFLLRASRPRVDMSESASLPSELGPRLQGIPGIASIDELSFSVASVQGVTATLMVRQFPGYETLPVDLIEGDPQLVREKLTHGEMVVGTVVAHKLQCQSGDDLQVKVSGISRQVRIAGIAKEYTAGGLMIIMDRTAALPLFPIESPQVYAIRTDPGARHRIGERLRSVAREQGLIFQSMADLRELVQGMIAGLTNRLWMILILALIIAGFAIINTLTMNIIEQTRYLGVLRVVGMSRMQVFRMFVCQAFVLGLLALVPGALAGVLMGFLITTSFRGVSDHAVEFTVHPILLGGYLICGILLSLLAALLPAIRAGFLNPLEAIHQE